LKCLARESRKALIPAFALLDAIFVIAGKKLVASVPGQRDLHMLRSVT